MKKLLVVILFLCLLAWGSGIVHDRQTLRSDLIRLHVVGQSDSEEDQSIKLQVRDAILAHLETAMSEMPDMETAKQYLQSSLENLEEISNQVLEAAGSKVKAVVTLKKEAFPTRYYETFSLPAGVYESLRVTIGEGEGKNWWCVVFPKLCIGATSAEMEDTAVGAGFSEELSDTLAGKPQTKMRFFVLDCLGWLENLFYCH